MLEKLNDSKRNWIFERSVMEKNFASEKSRLCKDRSVAQIAQRRVYPAANADSAATAPGEPVIEEAVGHHPCTIRFILVL